MRIWIGAAIVVIVVAMGGWEPVSAQETARLLVLVEGGNIASNDVLFDYANKMNMDAIASLARSHPKDIIHYTELIAKLPAPLNGWTAGEAQGVNFEMTGMKYSVCQNTYRKTGAKDEVNVFIWDTFDQQSGPWAGYWATQFQFETNDAYGRTAKVQGYPAYEYRTKTEKQGFLTIGITTAVPVPEIGSYIWVLALASAVVASRKLHS